MDKDKFQLSFDQKVAGGMKTICEASQIAIIIPVIPAKDEVPVLETVTEVRGAIEKVLLDRGLLFTGVATKLMSGRIPETMVEQLVTMREKHQKELVDRKGRKSRVRRLKDAWKNE